VFVPGKVFQTSLIFVGEAWGKREKMTEIEWNTKETILKKLRRERER
jgi:hypothetical protein